MKETELQRYPGNGNLQEIIILDGGEMQIDFQMKID